MSEQALLYVRVSSKPQEKDGYSLDAQENFGREYAKSMALKFLNSGKLANLLGKKIVFHLMKCSPLLKRIV